MDGKIEETIKTFEKHGYTCRVALRDVGTILVYIDPNRMPDLRYWCYSGRFHGIKYYTSNKERGMESALKHLESWKGK